MSNPIKPAKCNPPAPGAPYPWQFPKRRELIVIAKRDAKLRSTREGVTSAVGMDVAPLSKFLAEEGVTLQPLFGVSEEDLRAEAAAMAPDANAPDLSVYYYVEAPDEQLDRLAEQLRHHDVLEAAYVKPPAVLPRCRKN